MILVEKKNKGVLAMLSLSCRSLRLLPLTASCSQMRWKHRVRKPLSKGRAKSKMFIVKDREVIPDDEKLELQRLYSNYRTGMKTVRAYLAGELEREAAREHVEEDIEEEWERCIALNMEDNAEVAKEREGRTKRLFEERCEALMKESEEHQRKLQEERRTAEELVRLTEEYVSKLIKPEELDSVIEDILARPPVSYNFAIDSKGNKISKSSYLIQDPNDVRRSELASVPYFNY